MTPSLRRPQSVTEALGQHDSCDSLYDSLVTAYLVCKFVLTQSNVLEHVIDVPGGIHMWS